MTTTTDLNKLVLQLREKTGAGFNDCKKALVEANGDLEAAVTALRKKGLADAAKKSARATKEGVVAYAKAGAAAALVELNSETDFVARNEEFQKLAQTLAEKYAKGELKDVEAAKELVQPVFMKLGENMGLRRFERYELKGEGLLSGYIHIGAKNGAMIELSGPADEALAKELLMQIVAMKPKWVRREDVPAADVAREKEIQTESAKKEGKPEAALPKIIEGKMNKLFYQVWVLNDQLGIRDNKTPISQILAEAGKKAGKPISIARFTRYQLGE